MEMRYCSKGWIDWLSRLSEMKKTSTSYKVQSLSRLLFLTPVLSLVSVEATRHAFISNFPRVSTHMETKGMSTSKIPFRMSKKGAINSGRQLVVDAQPPRPHDNCYWVTNSFMAGEYPTDRSNNEEKTRLKLRRHLKCGITYFVDLTREGEKPNYADLLLEEASKLDLAAGSVVVKRFSIPDFGIPEDPGVMKEILDSIDEGIEQNHKVYVHCRGGIGRTGTTVGCYLARHGYTGEDALKAVNRLFQNSGRSMESYYSPETTDQMNFVRGWVDG